MNPLITPQEADILLARSGHPLAAEDVPLAEAAGRVLTAPLLADRPLPPFHRVMMDGIACSHAEARSAMGRLEVAGFHPAGAPNPAALAPGTCWEVGTGAVLPSDCDTILPVEVLKRDGCHVVFDPAECNPGRFIHSAGSDYPAGAELVPSGSTLGARECAVAASVGATTVSVHRLPRIHLFTTGNEIIAPDEAPLPHQIRQSNGPALAAALHALNANAPRHEHLPDEEEHMKSRFGEALASADLILCCGGISKGKHDHVRSALTAHLGEPVFHGIAQRPGKPLAFWDGPSPVFALPGNPMSVLVCFHRYVVSFLRRMSGGVAEPPLVELSAPVHFTPPLAYFLPVALTPHLRADPRPLANSGDFASAIDATGFLELPADRDHFPAGFEAPYTPWL